jgi:arylsulfatase
VNYAKKTLVRILGLTLFAAACSDQENIEHTANIGQSDKPNILLVLVDDMGFSDIGAYGSEVQTPNLDSLASQGMRFNQFRNTSKCYPTRAALMTGQYAQQVGMSVDPASLKNHTTLGEVLRTAGYKTLMVGKHHGLDNPYDMGFDHYWGMRDGAANHFNPGYQRDGEAFPAQKRQNQRVFCFDAKCVQPFTPDRKDYYTTDAFTDWAIDLLGRHDTENDEQPFFMYLAYTAPHDPIQAWPEDIAKYEGKYDDGYEAIAKARYERQIELGIIDAQTHPRSNAMHRDWDSLSAEEQTRETRAMSVYSAMIDSIDQNLGRVLAHLDETGELSNTLVIFLSDNGASAEVVEIGEGEIGAIDRWASVGGHWANVSNVPFKGYKNSSFEGGIQTPFIVNWPGVIPPTSAINETSSHLVDIMATLVDITGATYPKSSVGRPVGDMDGISLLPAFRNGTMKRNKPIFFQFRDGKAIIDGRWKLVVHKASPEETESGLWDFSTSEWELYDLSSDRTEINNLAKSNPGKLAELRKKYDAWWMQVEPEITIDQE